MEALPVLANPSVPFAFLEVPVSLVLTTMGAECLVVALGVPWERRDRRVVQVLAANLVTALAGLAGWWAALPADPFRLWIRGMQVFPHVHEGLPAPAARAAAPGAWFFFDHPVLALSIAWAATVLVEWAVLLAFDRGRKPRRLLGFVAAGNAASWLVLVAWIPLTWR